MKSAYSLILASLTGSAFAGAGDVLALTDANFVEEMANIELTIVKFYAPWCGHCKRMVPEMDKAAKILAENDPPLQLVKVDCTIHTKICGEYEVSGYPSLKLFRNGVKVSDYSGGRTSDDFVKTLTGMAGPASGETASIEKFDKKLDSSSPIVIGFFESAEAPGFMAFSKAADELRENTKFSHVFSSEITAHAGMKNGNIVLYRPKIMKSKFEDQVVTYDKSKYTVGLVRNWVKLNAPGLVPVVKLADQEERGFPQINCYYNVNYDKDPKGTQYWRNRVMKVAQKFAETKKEYKFGVANNVEWAGVLNEAGLSKFDGKAPACIAFDDKNSKYVMDRAEAWSMDKLEAFVNSYDAGELSIHIKSQDDFDNEGKGNKDLTAKTFKSYVDGTKDTFIKFYAPWCGHCKTIAPKWDELGEAFLEDDDIVISSFDADSNDVPEGFEVKGFPTLFFMKAGGKPEKYTGAREVEDFVKFVNENRTNKKEDVGSEEAVKEEL